MKTPLKPENDPRQMDLGAAFDEIRARREEVIEEAKTESRPTADPTGSTSPHDRGRALKRWKTGWLAWDGGGRLGESYDALFTALTGSPTLDALVERYWSQHRAKEPAAYVDAAHYNAGVQIERRNAGLA